MTHEEYTLPTESAPANHGHTRSAWVLTLTVLAGLTFVGVGMSIPHVGLMVFGAAIVVVGSVIAWILRSQGHGQPLTARSSDWYEG